MSAGDGERAAEPALASRPIALVGLRCSGKTAVGAELARLLRRRFVDLDDEVAALAGADSAGAVIDEMGLATFRRLEARALERILTEGQRTDSDLGVLATGGGVVEGAVNRQWLALHTRCVWLRAEPAVLRRRMGADPSRRPSLTGADPADELEPLAARRAGLYESVAELQVDAAQGTPREVALRIQARLAPGTRGRQGPRG